MCSLCTRFRRWVVRQEGGADLGRALPLRPLAPGWLPVPASRLRERLDLTPTPGLRTSVWEARCSSSRPLPAEARAAWP